MQKGIQRIALIGKYQSPEVAEAVSRLALHLKDAGVDVLIERETATATGIVSFPLADFAEIGTRADLAVVLGGDGSFLTAARRLAAQSVPLAGVNLGRLGFLTDIPLESMFERIGEILAGRSLREERMLLEAEVLRGGECVFRAMALNDVVLSKGESGRMIEFELHVDGEFVYSQRSDGIIVSTPTGSTAYAMSANGPILHPGVTGIALVPLCPHALTHRPVTVSDQCQVELVIAPRHDAQLHFDGQERFDAHAGDRLRIRRSAHTLSLLHPPGYSYFSILREKLHWSTTPRLA
ncbi:NAD kinase [Niveibacterium sp. SC-1]|uniref:NAD kinase n=1 Tax=Niveibacterium sp. SC-1 TaxID=3135646 RepID=UPI00311E9EF4